MVEKTTTKKRELKKKGASQVVKLESAGDSCEGILKQITVKDLFSPKTKTSSPTRMYHFQREGSDERFVVTGRAMLDDQFDEVAMEKSDGSTTEEPGGMDALRGLFFRITRLEDQKTQSGNSLGIYELEYE